MKTRSWRVDPATEVTLELSFGSKGRVLVNGTEVVSKMPIKKLSLQPFSLGTHGTALVTTYARTFSAPEISLRVGERYIPDSKLIDAYRCQQCGARLGAMDRFCSDCGAGTPDPSTMRHKKTAGEAATAIRVVAALYVLGAVIVYLAGRADYHAGLANLAQFSDAEVLQPLGGVTYTAGQLRTRMQAEFWGLIAVNIALALLMVALAWWSRQNPLAAIMIAMAVYVAVIVLNAIINPISLAQGWLVKIIILTVLARGMTAALALRHSHA